MVTQDYKDDSGKWVLRYRDANNVQRKTKLGHLHDNLRQKARVGGSWQKKAPEYVGTSLHPHFQDAQRFCDWATSQPGYHLGWDLDKDLLVNGNKVYGPFTSVFLPRVLNIAIRRQGDAATGRPQGVFPYNKSGKWHAAIGFKQGGEKFRLITLKVTDTPEEAHSHYCEFKELYVRMLADTYKGQLDPRAYQALQYWTVQAPTLH